jgi:hypothetical protein
MARGSLVILIFKKDDLDSFGKATILSRYAINHEYIELIFSPYTASI